MDVAFRPRDGPDRAAPVESAPRPASVRPGLPLTLTIDLSGAANGDASLTSDIAREVATRRDTRGDPPSETDAEGGGEAGDQTRAGGEEGAADAEAGSGAAEETEAQAQGGGGGAARSDRQSTPLQIRVRQRPSPFKKAKPPVLPRVEIPDRAGIRAPVVPPPPASVVE